MLVEVKEHNPEWVCLYLGEAEQIKKIFQDELIEIYHIGSTSVKGLKAKPVIDIMPVVKDINNIDQYNDKFIELGYEPMGEYGISKRRFFRKGGEKRTHHIHIFQITDRENIERHLAVRDYLREHSEDAAAYGELKYELAQKYPKDIEVYCDGKDLFVKNLEKKALAWYKK
ncbi:GrpB family protein [Fusobacterium sp.]|uniref:GrpB family protein n=1 Tax=Fusobacterium sp. TaxID=68766 RepID=UPI0028FE1993|nr:GrpB family protein [Fusobacterium sp.]MDU1910409.1 GrpB family protein [Fusobacterium sp.]